MNTSAELLYEKRGRVAWVTFNRPKRRNAMTFPMYDRLEEISEELGEDREIRVAVFRGAGHQAFVAGTEITQFRDFNTPGHAERYEQRLERVFSKIEEVPVATIAMVRGFAVGGGAQLAMVCDLCYCSPSARFGVPMARTLGNCLSGSGYARLIERIGPLRTRELLFTGRFLDAQEALAHGVVSRVFPEEELESGVSEVAAMIAANAPLTIQVTKQAVLRQLRRNRLSLESDLFMRCYESADFQEGVRSFLEKRYPRWKGR